MSEELFRVAFRGVTSGEYDLVTTKSRFQKLFRLSPARVEQLFSGREFVLKYKVGEEVAMKFAFKVAETGCECYIETLSEDALRSGTIEFQERREENRRVQFRRGPRQGAKVSDRRITVGRRRTDPLIPVEPALVTSGS